MSRLTVVLASRKLVRLRTENLSFQLFSQKGSEIEIKRRAFVESVSSNFLNGQMTLPSEEREWLSKKIDLVGKNDDKQDFLVFELVKTVITVIDTGRYCFLN